jgi:hypothetical protein
MTNAVPTLDKSEEAMRTLIDIKNELAEATERRTELWKQLSAVGADPDLSAEIAAVSGRIESLWQEARTEKTRTRFGAQEAIIARARADERLERELGRVA